MRGRRCYAQARQVKKPQLFPEPAQLARAADTKHTPSYAPHLASVFWFLVQGARKWFFLCHPFQNNNWVEKPGILRALLPQWLTRASCCNQMGSFIQEKGKMLEFGIPAAVNQRAARGRLFRPPLEASPSESFVIENKLKDSLIYFFCSAEAGPSGRFCKSQVKVLSQPVINSPNIKQSGQI